MLKQISLVLAVTFGLSVGIESHAQIFKARQRYKVKVTEIHDLETMGLVNESFESVSAPLATPTPSKSKPNVKPTPKKEDPKKKKKQSVGKKEPLQNDPILGDDTAPTKPSKPRRKPKDDSGDDFPDDSGDDFPDDSGDDFPDDPYNDPSNDGDGVFNGGNKVTIGDFVVLGTKVWDFILDNKPNATTQKLMASVVPSGIEDWQQLTGWSKPLVKKYHVDFENIFGKVAGGFDYKIVFVSGGNYQGKGRFIGQIAVSFDKITLKTDRTLDVKAEILDPLNFGTEDNPMAGVQVQITWSSPTSTRFSLDSVDLFLYGDGRVDNLSE